MRAACYSKDGPIIKRDSKSFAFACSVGLRLAKDLRGTFNNKKEKRHKSLFLLNPKRQIRAVYRQFRVVDRHKSLALLSVMCQRLVRLVTIHEDKNDGRTTNCDVGNKPDHH